MGLFDLFRKKTPTPPPVEKKAIQQETATAPAELDTPQPIEEISNVPPAAATPIATEAQSQATEVSEPTAEKTEIPVKEPSALQPSAEILSPEPTAPEELEDKEQLQKSLSKTKEGLFAKITKVVVGKSTVDADVLDELEEVLITSDVGVNTTLKIIKRIENRVAREKYLNPAQLNDLLRDEIQQLLTENNSNDFENFEYGQKKPYVIMVVGVNGVGKTTTIGKLAYKLKAAGNQVVLGAADTFRAAAVDQLKLWGERVGVRVVAQAMGSDPASVAFDTVQSAAANGDDVAIIDTAGRLHNKVTLMNELSKIKNVMDKIVPGAPHEILLVLDASTGQNAIEQCRQFTEATAVNALALTKLDGTAKGGVVIGISDEFKIPVKYIGVGESINDLQLFNKKEFVASLFKA